MAAASIRDETKESQVSERGEASLLLLLQHHFYDVYMTRPYTITHHPMARRRRPPRPGALADLAPLRILTQIVALQFSYYSVALILIVFTTFVAGRHPNAGLLLDWHNLRGDVTTGWTLGLCWMLDSLITYACSQIPCNTCKVTDTF